MVEAENARQLRRSPSLFDDLCHVHAQNVGHSHITCQALSVGRTRACSVGSGHNHQMQQKSTFGSRVKHLRVSRRPKLTQYEVAAALGISRSHLTKIETGGDMPGRSILSAFADYFGVSRDYLETGTESPGSQLSENLPDSSDERAWILLGKELSEADKLAVTEFVRSTILRQARQGRRRNK